MFDGYLELLPIQGGIVAAVLLVITIVKIKQGVRGTDAITWNAIGLVCFLYLFVTAAWFAFGGNPPG
jgi:hypothetical protein